MLNIPFKANNRFQKSLESYASLAPRSNQIYSLSNQASPTLPPNNTVKSSKLSDYDYEELAFPSGDSVYINSVLPSASSQAFTPVSMDQNTLAMNSNGHVHDGDKPNPETSAKLRQAMLKRTNSVKYSPDSCEPNKRAKLETACHCPHFSDESVTKLYKQVLLLKKRTLRQKFEKQELEKQKLKLEAEKLKIETEKLKLEAEAAKIKR